MGLSAPPLNNKLHNMKPKAETIIRNAKMIEDYEKLPRIPMSEIGRKYGVSRQYVHQVVHKHYNKLEETAE